VFISFTADFKGMGTKQLFVFVPRYVIRYCVYT